MTRGTVFALFKDKVLYTGEFSGDMGCFDRAGQDLLELLRRLEEAVKHAGGTKIDEKVFTIAMDEFNKLHFNYDDFEVGAEKVDFIAFKIAEQPFSSTSDYEYYINLREEPVQLIDKKGNTIMLEYNSIAVFNFGKRLMKIYPVSNYS